MNEELSFYSYETKGINNENLMIREYSDGSMDVVEINFSKSAANFRYILPYAIFKIQRK